MTAVDTPVGRVSPGWQVAFLAASDTIEAGTVVEVAEPAGRPVVHVLEHDSASLTLYAIEPGRVVEAHEPSRRHALVFAAHVGLALNGTGPNGRKRLMRQRARGHPLAAQLPDEWRARLVLWSAELVRPWWPNLDTLSTDVVRSEV